MLMVDRDVPGDQVPAVIWDKERRLAVCDAAAATLAVTMVAAATAALIVVVVFVMIDRPN